MKKISGLIVLSAGILWGMIGIFIRTLSAAGLSSLQIVFMRVVFGGLLLSAAALIKDYKMLKIRWKDCWCFLGTGIAGFAFFNYCYFSTMQYASLSVAAVLLYMAPSFVILFSSVLFQERITFRKICALIFAFSGCMCATGLFAGETVL
ncbi:MAG: DMT family transporter [Lachnospiraceae bacterium]|nr:DMT family transporter [Lachnospiraceae bacterium]